MTRTLCSGVCGSLGPSLKQRQRSSVTLQVRQERLLVSLLGCSPVHAYRLLRVQYWRRIVAGPRHQCTLLILQLHTRSSLFNLVLPVIQYLSFRHKKVKAGSHSWTLAHPEYCLTPPL